ncbi:MAG: hypothetical protein LBE38_00025 [Deltaproteobacteria bacterium]|jgi:hypothetical protein|nr:hypothetical protein [Deltaproteobacteria bacterium]
MHKILFYLAFILFALTFFVKVPGLLAQQPGAAEDNATTLLQKAINAHSVGDNTTALQSLWEAEELIWNMGPMGVRNVAYILTEPEYFSQYTPKVGETFLPNELLIFYCEPFGYTQRKNADGTYSNSLMWSFNVLNVQGEPIGGQQDIGPYPHDGYRTFLTDKMLTLTISLSQIPPGSYILQIILIDYLNPSHTVEIQKPFNLIVPE